VGQRASAIAFEGMPLEEAQRRTCGPRMTTELSTACKQNMQSLDNTATCLPLPEGTGPTTMNNRILRTAATLVVGHSDGDRSPFPWYPAVHTGGAAGHASGRDRNHGYADGSGGADP
jgi:hypothetical protein